MRIDLKKTIKDTLLAISRIVLALTFIVSGFAKLGDPMGAVYKLTEYIAALGMHSIVPHPILITFGAIAIGVLEFMIGLMLLFAANRRLASLLALVFMLAVTPLTLWLAIDNPISDCGCFGDFVHLTNWQTFAKNLVLLACAIIVNTWCLDMTRIVSERGQWMLRLYGFAYAVILACVCLFTLPAIDVMPYHIGAHIGQDEGTLPFMAIDAATGEDHTEELTDDGYTLLLISDNLTAANDGEMDRINLLATYANRNGMRMAMLTATEDAEAINGWCDMTGAEYPIYWSDETELRTMIRSNPGLMLLHDGIVTGKWSHYGIPELSMEAFQLPPEQQEWTKAPEQSMTYQILKLLLWFAIPLAIWTLLDKIYKRLKKDKG